MAMNANFFKNLGKSVAYSSVNVMGDLAPSTSELVRSARSGVDSARNFMRENTTKIRTSTTQLDRTAVARKARAYLQDAMADIRSGNISLGEIASKSEDDLDSILQDIEAASGPLPESESSEAPQASRKAPGVDLSALQTTATVKGMQQMEQSLGTAMVKTTQYQTDKITTTLFSQMASQTHHFQIMERQLDSINKNLVQLVGFQRDSQGVINQAQLHFFDNVSRWMTAQEKRNAELAKSRPNSKHSPMDGFMSSGWFDASAYKKIVKSNIDNSELGTIMSGLGLISPDMLKLAFGSKGGKIQPQRFLLEALLRAAVPKSARQSIGRGDSQVNIMMKTMLGRLGSYKYQMDSHPIMGLLGSIFGIDTRAQRTLKLGNYKHGEMSWNGDAQKALTSVIPKELAEIKSAILKTGEPKYFDAQTGTYMTKDDVKARTRLRYQQSVETPFANIFNRISANPNDIANRKLWAGMDEETKKKISELINQAVTDNSGMTDEWSEMLDKTINDSITQLGGTLVDTRRMTAALSNAVNVARDQTVAYIKELQESDSAFTQIASDLADKYGKVSFKKLQDFMGAENIDLVAANEDRYTQSGRRRSAMTEEERARYDSSMGFIQSFGKRLKDLESSPDPKMRTVGKALGKITDRFVYGSRSKYAKTITKFIDDGFGEIYDVAMLGHRRRRPDSGAGGDAGPDTGVPPEGGVGGGRPTPHLVLRALRGATTSRTRSEETSQSMGDNAQMPGSRDSSGHTVGNEAYKNSLNQSSPEERTASASEETSEVINDAMGKHGYFRKFFDSPAMKKFLNWFGKSKVGQYGKEKLSQGAAYIKQLFTEEYTDDDGNVHSSVKTNIKGLLGQYRDFLFRNLGFDPETGKKAADTKGTPVGAAEKATDAINQVTEAVAGDTDGGPDATKKKTSTILKSLNDIIHKKAPKILTGGVIGAAVGASTGGSLGIIGSMFLPGGPVGGAIAGMGLSILSQTEAFQSLMFGKKNKEGDREGGLISKKMVDGFKQALPTIGKGAAAGGAIGLAAKFLGVKAGVAGVIPSMLLPGGIFGAALMGSAAALALRNDKVQDILFGKADDDGKRTGSLLSNMYNKFTGKVKSIGKNGLPKSFSMSDKAKSIIKGVGIGALTSMTIGKMGLMGSLFSLGGPIGGAVAGAALGIASSSDTFNNYLFGTKGPDDKRGKDGLFSRFQAAIDLNILTPAKNWFNSTAQEFAWWAKEKIEVPFRMAFGPILDSFADLRDTMKDTATGVIENIGEKVGGTIKKILEPVGGFFLHKVLSPMGKFAGGLLKGGLFAAGSMVSAPLQLLSLAMSPKRRKGQKLFGNFLKENRDENLQQRWSRQEEDGETVHKGLDSVMYRMATLPGIGNLFRKNEMIQEMGQQWADSPDGEGRNNLDWIGAPADRKKYKVNRKQVKRDAKAERKITDLRRQFGKFDKYNRDAVLSEDEIKRRQKMAKKLGIDLKDEDDLKKFTYDYSAWKNPGETSEAKAEEAQNVVTTEVPLIRKLLEKLDEKFGKSLDTQRAQFDVETGPTIDSSDIDMGSMAEKVDSDVAAKVNSAKAKNQADAMVDALTRQEEKKRRKAEHDRITGNTSGNAHDTEDNAGNLVTQIQEEGSSKKTSLLDKIGGGLSGILGLIMKIPGVIPLAIAGITGALLSNENIRNFLGDVLGKAGGAIKDAIFAAPGAIAETGAKTLGLNGGVNNQRALEVDEEGNATKSVLNGTFIQRLTSAAIHPGRTLSAAHGLLRRVVPGLATAEKVVTKAGDLAGKAGSRLWGAAKSAAASAAEKAAGGGNLTMVDKALNLIKGALEKAATSKLGKTFKGLGALFSKISKFFKGIYDKLIGKSLAKWSSKLAAALAAAGVTNVAWVTPAALINIAYTAGSAILGAIYPEKLFKINKDQVDWKMRVISAIFEAIMAATGIGALVGVISEIVSEFTGFDFIQSLADIIYRAMSSDEDRDKLTTAMDNMKQEVANYNEANGTNLSLDAYNDLKNKGFFGGMWNGIKNIFGAGDKTDYSQYEVGNYQSQRTGGFNKDTTSGGAAAIKSTKAADKRGSFSDSRGGGFGGSRSTATGYGLGDTQNDKRWSRKVIGTFPSGKPATMGAAGCGPTALANAAGALGVKAKPDQVASFASRHGYISEGGANDGLFDEGASQMGLSTRRVNSTGSIVQNLKHGNPVILAGKGSGGATPYTKAGHIVTATGIDGSGNVAVQDPKSRGTKKYKLKDLQSRMTNGWAVSRGATGYGLFDDLLGGIFSSATTALYDKLGIQKGEVSEDEDGARGNGFSGGRGGGFGGSRGGGSLSASESAKHIWDYLTKAGYTPTGASGVMGCWQSESNNRADRVEGDFLKSFPGFEKVLASNQALDDYTTKILFPAYKNTKINKGAYKGADGHYYPGIGLAQWTGPRGYNLFKYAQANGKDWRDIDTQLAFFASEIDGRGLKSKINAAKNPEDAAHIVLDGYEMYQGFGAKTPSYLNPRQAAAKSIYNQFTGSSAGRGPARGYGLFDDLLGSSFGTLTDAIYNKLGIQKDSGATDDGQDDTDAGVQQNRDGTYPTYANSGQITKGQKDVVDMMASKYGKLRYSLGSVQDPDQGVASCASTVGWAYKKALGVSGMSASSTAQSKNPDFQTIWTNTGSPLPLNILKPGDVLYQHWKQTRNNGSMQHTEMYAGDGKDLSHGGPGAGPVYKDLTPDRRSHTMMVRRYKPFMNAGYGDGDTGYSDQSVQQMFSLSRSGQHGTDRSLPTIGYGPGAITASGGSTNRGVETRLDTVISILRAIATSSSTMANKKAGPTQIIGYGPGDTKTVVEPVVISQPEKRIGAEDAENNSLKQMHMKLASTSRFNY